eukprot:scaffold28452_cov13-Prasinocladus_malaysianus.AAC.1
MQYGSSRQAEQCAMLLKLHLSKFDTMQIYILTIRAAIVSLNLPRGGWQRGFRVRLSATVILPLPSRERKERISIQKMVMLMS